MKVYNYYVNIDTVNCEGSERKTETEQEVDMRGVMAMELVREDKREKCEENQVLRQLRHFALPFFHSFVMHSWQIVC